MAAAPFSVLVVADDAPEKAETMGTKPKFWFLRDEKSWLFKFTRRGQGENWAEVLAAALAERPGLPHADYELARCGDEAGVATPRFTPDDFDRVHGNELLAEQDPNYAIAGGRYIRTAQHTIGAVAAVVGASDVKLPMGWEPPAGIRNPVDVFGGYLLLDAWIGNTDRHHENWALVASLRKNRRHLAPTFDHASSLGSHEIDEVRSRRLSSVDPGFSVEAYARRSRVRSALFMNAGDEKPLGLPEAFWEWAKGSNCMPWLDRLDGVSDEEVTELVARVPESQMTGPARAFAQAILGANKRRILRMR